VFPEIELQPDKQNIDGWSLTTSQQVGYFGSGVGGTIIGFGANLAISDDLYKSMQDALSENTNNGVKMWKESAHDSRMEKNCPEIFIGTRWRKDDIIGDAMDSVRIKQSVVISAMIDGQSFCEDVKSTYEYNEIKSRIGASIWEAEYQQNPQTKEGLLLPIETLKFADLQKNNDVLYRFSTGDPADTGGDKFNCLFIDVINYQGKIRAYVRSVIHSTDGMQSTVNRIGQRLIYHKTENIYYEINGVGLAAALLQESNKPDETTIKPFSSNENKEVRVLSYYEFIQAYFIFDENYKDDPEYKAYIDDLTSYVKAGDNKHRKDAIDNTSTAAKILKLKYKL
jgi:predicted phage terminase large subunit-like protein